MRYKAHDWQEDIRAFVMLCMVLTEDMSYKEVGERAGLAGITVQRLHQKAWEGTPIYSRFETLCKLGEACGITVTWKRNSMRISAAA